MPASRTPKRTTRKDKGKAPATPRPSSSRNPSTHYAQLFSYPTLRNPTWLDKVLVALFILYAHRSGQTIAIQEALVDQVNTLSLINQQYSLAGSRKSWLTNVYGALASFRYHNLIEWNDHRENDESIRLTQKLTEIFDALFEDVKAEKRFRKLLSLNVSQYRALFMVAKDYCKKNGIKNLTKHELHMNQMDVEKQKNELQAQYTQLIENTTSDEQPTRSSQELEHNDSSVTGMHGKQSPTAVRPNNQNAVAGPSRLPQTPRRSSMHNSAGVYPTPESRPRRTHAEEFHGAVSTAEPRIRAPSLRAPTGGDSDNDDFYDVSNGMDVDDPLPPPPNHLELALESQVAGLTRENATLLSQNAELQKEVDGLKSQIAEMDRQIKEEKAAKEKVQKELEQTEGRLGKAQGTELYLRDKLERAKFEADKLVDPKRLGLSLARYSALSERYGREITQLRAELNGHKTTIAEYEAVQKQNEEAAAAFQARFKFVGVRRQ